MIGQLSGDYVVGRLLAILPEIETISLEALQADQTWASGVSWQAKREEASHDDLIMSGLEGTDTAIAFSLFMTDTVAQADPTIINRIVDANSVTWTIKHVNPKKMFQRVFRCVCIRNL